MSQSTICKTVHQYNNESVPEMDMKNLQEIAKGIRCDNILFGMPMGERILVNDRKTSGLDMAVAVNLDRDMVEMIRVVRENKASKGKTISRA